MVTYQYKAVSKDGVNVSGVVEAPDEFSAVEKIKATCPIVLKLKPVKEKEGIFSKEIGNPKINAKNLSVMCSQFAIILNSGVPISRCMEMIADQTEDKQLHKMLKKSAEDVAQGNGVASSFEKNCKGIPVTFIETVRAGEQSGTLENSFQTLEAYYAKSNQTTQKVKQALSYPIFVILIAIVVVIVIMVKVVPTLTTTFADLGGDMPTITKILIAVSNFFQHAWIWIIMAILALIIGTMVFAKTEPGKIFFGKLKLKLPGFGKLGVLGGASQYANTMSTLLAAGMSVSEALQTTGKVMDNYVLGIEVNRMVGSVEEGKRLGDTMRKCKWFPTTLTEMCAIGEETGSLEDSLQNMGAYYDNEADHATKQLISKLEPTIMVFLALFAGFIVISIYMPMFSMYNLM